MKHSKFTVLEMLLVICVVAILFSLTFPAFRRSMEMGRHAVCASNTNQIYRASAIYSSNNKGFIPYLFDDTTKISFDDLLSAYTNRPLSDAQMRQDGYTAVMRGTIWNCPSDIKVFKLASAVRAQPENRRSYGYISFKSSNQSPSDPEYGKIKHSGVSAGGSSDNAFPGTMGAAKYDKPWSQRLAGSAPASPYDRAMVQENCSNRGAQPGGRTGAECSPTNLDPISSVEPGGHLKGVKYVITVFKDGHYEYTGYAQFSSPLLRYSNSDENAKYYNDGLNYYGR
ncbi:MAG: hypothetical protein RL095_3683 [Verrucomicrobiota bacterium]|jgi:Tfp pilus assembly protein PilE